METVNNLRAIDVRELWLVIEPSIRKKRFGKCDDHIKWLQNIRTGH